MRASVCVPERLHNCGDEPTRDRARRLLLLGKKYFPSPPLGEKVHNGMLAGEELLWTPELILTEVYMENVPQK